MKTRLLITFVFILFAGGQTFAQTGDWIAGDETVGPANPVPSLGQCVLSGSFTWLSFDTYNNANHAAVLSYAIPPCLDAASGVPTLTDLSNVTISGVTFVQTGQQFKATLPANITLAPGTKLIFKISGLNVYDHQNFSGQQASHSISYISAPSGDQLANNIATIIFGTQIGAAPLPVTLLSFDATLVETPHEAKVSLDWKTTTERNSDYFEVQRSVDGADWFTIGQKVAAAGNSSTEKKYNTFDYEPIPGITYYRLKQVDLDGNSYLSEIRKIIYKGIGRITLFPNPVADILNAKIELGERSLVDIKILNMQGSVVRSVTAWTNKGVQTLSLDISTMANGLYEVNVYVNNNIMHSGKVQKK